MAHMWFGNLVGITAWGELYIKESIADYMAYLAGCNLDTFTKANNAPGCVMFSERKTRGMLEDMETLMMDTMRKDDFSQSVQQFIIYNNNTYGKGFAVIHALFNMFGGAEFFGEWAYFFLTKFKGQAVGSDQFINSIADTYQNSENSKNHFKYFGVEVLSWQLVRDIVQSQIGAKGIDELIFTRTDSGMTVTQSPSEGGKFKYHYFDIAFYDLNH